MTQTLIADIAIQLDDEGYLTDSSQWTLEIANEIARDEGIELTEKHVEVIHYLRGQFNGGTRLTIRRIGKSGIVDIKEFYDLFPGGPLKKASRIAGIPKPASCV